jgi:Zn-dependent M16 (insulinase) family peptidase
MTVVVTGQQIDPQRLLETISRTTERDIERAGLARGPHPKDWIRPFVESITAENDPIIEKDKTILVPYADTDTSTGEIDILFVGPPLKDTLSSTAIGVLGDYLSGSPHSVLNRKFVEISEPACAGKSFPRCAS